MALGTGLVSDGIAFTTQPFRRSSGGAVAAGGGGAGGGGSGLSSALLGGRSGGVEQRATEGALASRGDATGLHMAAALGQKAKLQALVDGAQPGAIDAGDLKRYTPFHVACAGGHAECVTLLVQAGCDTSLRCDTVRPPHKPSSHHCSLCASAAASEGCAARAAGAHRLGARTAAQAHAGTRRHAERLRRPSPRHRQVRFNPILIRFNPT